MSSGEAVSDTIYLKRFGAGLQQENGSDRRCSDRFPIEREVRFRILGKRGLGEEGKGTTINISSNGVLLVTEKDMQPGRRVELSISWPAQLDNRCLLKLVARGRVARVEADGRIAVEIQQYEFRTAGKAA
jgi:hypothetical protein